MSTTAAIDSSALAPEIALDPIISELRARILDAPDRLEGNEESRLHAEATLSTTFEVGFDGNMVGGFEQELQLAKALATDTFVVRDAFQYVLLLVCSSMLKAGRVYTTCSGPLQQHKRQQIWARIRHCCSFPLLLHTGARSRR